MKSKKLLNLFLPVIMTSVITSTTMVFAKSNLITANPTSSALLVDGEQVNFSAYNINGNNYFKLRDLAYILNGSLSQFDIGFDSSRNLITINTNQNYNAVGGEMIGNSNGSQNAVISKANLMIDGQKVNLTAYNIGGNNFFMLRDLAAQIGFDVDWNASSSSIIVNTGGTLTTNVSDVDLSNNDVIQLEDWTEEITEFGTWCGSIDFQLLYKESKGLSFVGYSPISDGYGTDYEFDLDDDEYGTFNAIIYTPGTYTVSVDYVDEAGNFYNGNIILIGNDGHNLPYVEYEEDYHSEGVFYQEDEEEYVYMSIGETIDIQDYIDKYYVNEYDSCSFWFVRPEYDGVSYELEDVTQFTPFYRGEYILEIQYDIGGGEMWGKYIHFIAE